MSWKKHFQPIKPLAINKSPISGASSGTGIAKTNYSSYLPDVYTGASNRLERYGQYDAMNLDSEINAALDILAEFCTQENDENLTPFGVKLNGSATNSEVKIIKEYLQQWSKLQQFETRIFRIVRNTYMYGDSFFIRDPETFEWFYIDPSKIVKIIVNESDGKKPEQYIIRDLNVNFQHLVTTQINPSNQSPQPVGANYITGGPHKGMTGAFPQSSASRFNLSQNEQAIDAQHVIHLSMSEGLDNNFPFGNSLLESVFKVYKQKELLEDAVIIYRVHRAPERRVFYIDVGSMPSHLAMSFVERVKNEIHQRRIPSATGGSQSVIDSTYSPLSTMEDYFFPTTSEGRGSKVETLPGGCLAMDTKIPLLDGRILTLSELTEEYNQGKQNWVYSCDPNTGEVVPGLISWAGITQESADVVKITLDNRETIICTPDHNFPILDKGKVCAENLVLSESMIPFNHRNKKISDHKKLSYTQVYQNNTKTWEYVHRLIKKHINLNEFIWNDEYALYTKDVIHHKDHDRFNNNPDNLVLMSFIDHKKYHSDHGFSKEAQQQGTLAAAEKLKKLKDEDIELYNQIIQKISDNSKRMWENRSIEDRQHISNKQSTGIKKFFESLTDEERELRANKSRVNGAKAAETTKKLYADSEYRNLRGTQIKEGFAKFRETEQYIDFCNQRSKQGKLNFQNPEFVEKVFKNQRIKLDKKILDTVQELIKGKPVFQSTAHQVVDWLNNDREILNHFLELNKETKCANWNNDKFNVTHIKALVKQFGYTNWKHFRAECNYYNHKIVNIEYLSTPITVGTLTIDANEQYHGYHTFALSVGVFTYNSNIGEVTDLTYFTNKMMRALRIPSSYLPTGADDSQQQYNDGRVGTAYIQELRFNKYCMRLQKLIQKTFDIEFKRFLYLKGVNIDPGLFNIALQTPQNFASYRQAELDNQRISTFTQMAGLPFVSKRFALRRFLGLSAEEIADNEILWKEEAGLGKAISNDSNAELRSVGISGAGIDSDLGNFTEPEQIPPEEGMEGENAAGDMSSLGGSSTPGGIPASGPPSPGMGGQLGV